MHVTDAGKSALVEGIAKVRDAIATDLVAKADETQIGHQVLSLVDRATHAGNGSAQAIVERATEAVERASEVVEDKSAKAVALVKGETVKKSSKVGAFWKVGVGVVVASAAAGSGYYLWQRRKAAAAKADERHAGAEVFEAPHIAPVADFEPGMADTQSPDTIDDQFAAEIDAEAEQFADAFVDSVETKEGEAAEAAPAADAEEFQAGMADTDSPDVVDEQFAAEVDAEAEELANAFVDSVEQPKEPVPGEERESTA